MATFVAKQQGDTPRVHKGFCCFAERRHAQKRNDLVGRCYHFLLEFDVYTETDSVLLLSKQSPLRTHARMARPSLAGWPRGRSLEERVCWRWL